MNFSTSRPVYKMFRLPLTLAGFFVLWMSQQATAQSASLWQDVNATVVQSFGARYSTPTAYRTLQLNTAAMREQLQQAPMEFSADAQSRQMVLTLPMADGSFQDFEIFESPVMAAGLAAHYPKIKTYAGRGISDPRAHLRIDVTNFGFHAMVLSPRGDVFIDPVSNESTDFYIAYNKKDLPRTYAFDCGVAEDGTSVKNDAHEGGSNISYKSSGNELKTYRLALACTGEYAATKGGTVAGALSGMVTSVNRVTGIYESEFGVRMQLIENDTQLIYLSSGTDPYSNTNGGAMLGQNQNTIDDVIGSDNYDFGHVFSTGGGGIAGLGVICRNNQKANGVTGLPNPTGDAFDVDYVAHEMGHQFGGDHTFNSTTGACGGGNRWGPTAYEPGSGSTIMAYAGICSPNDLQPHSDPFFHTGSYDEIMNYITEDDGATCPVVTPTGNTPPVVDTHTDYTIPFETPFRLTGTATDADGDSLSYMWEEIDKGPACAMNAPTGTAPSFRSFKADSVPYRYFPKLPSLLAGTTSSGETLPTYARSLNFRFTARDNREDGGGLSYDDDPTTLTVINTGTPFRVSFPNLFDAWAIGTTYTITWDVSSTDLAPISCANVNILLSTNGGYAWPITLAANTPNDGSEEIMIPMDVSLVGNTNRIMVQSVGNVFFDVSDHNFSIGTNTGLSAVDDIGEQVAVFPNPTNGIIQLSVNGFAGEAATIIVNDVTGRTVKQISAMKLGGNQDISFDLSNEPAGIYSVKLVTESGSTVKKIVKQ